MKRNITVTFASLLAVGLLGCGGSDPVPVPDALIVHGDASVSAGEQQMIDRHNATRGAQGVGALTANNLLNQIAQEQANYMADIGEFTHDDAFGGRVYDRAETVGYVYTTIGENVGFDVSAEQLYSGWLGSSGHYAQIVKPEYTEIGVGQATRGLYQYWSIVFGDR